MPVQIVDNNSATSVEDGTIQIGDLQNMNAEFKEHVTLTALPPRNIIGKRTSFYFTKSQVLALFDHYETKEPTADAIEISIGVQIPETYVTCDQGATYKDNSNCIGVIISMANQSIMLPHNEVDDYVLINGYRPTPNFVDVVICCPGSKPPPPES